MSTMTKTITLQIPYDKELNETKFSPEENYLMLKVGTEYLLEARKAVVELTQAEIYNKLQEESKEEIRKLEQKLEIDCLVQKEVYKQLEVKIRSIYDDFIANMKEDNEMTVKKYENENTILKKSLKEYTEKMRQIDEDQESILNVKLNIEREKWKIRDKEIDMTIAEYEKKIDKLVTTNDALLASMNKTTHMKGSEGEKLLYDLMKNTFQDFAGFDIIDMHTKGGEGDFHLRFDDFNILADAKNYKLHVPSNQREKIKKDLIKNEHIEFGWLVSLNSNIDKFDKSPVMYEWINTKQCLVYINNLCSFDDPSKILRIVWFTCKELYKYMMDRIEVDDEEFTELKEHKFMMFDKINNLRKTVKGATSTLNTLKNMIQTVDDELKEMLGKETTEIVESNSSLFDHWWDNNIEYVGDDTVNENVTDIWYKFKQENKDIIKQFEITIDKFKQFVKTRVSLSAIVMKNKSATSSFDIKGIRLKQIMISTDLTIEDVAQETNVHGLNNLSENKVIDKKLLKKQNKKKDILLDDMNDVEKALDKKSGTSNKVNYYINEDIDKSIVEYYNDINNDIFSIASLHNLEIYQVVSVLVRNRVISRRDEARGYDAYKETEHYKQQKCLGNAKTKRFG